MHLLTFCTAISFNSLGSVYYIFFKINEYFYLGKGALNWSKVTINTFIMLQKIYILNKCFSFDSSVNPEK